MNHSGISTAQSMGITSAGSPWPPKLIPRLGSPAAFSSARSRWTGSRAFSNLPAVRLAVTTARCPSTCAPCGVSTNAVSGPAAWARRPSSAMPRAVAAASFSGATASGTAMPPCGAMAAKTMLMNG